MLGILPRVFYPWHQLNYVRIFEKDGVVVVEYETIDKAEPKDLTILERLLTRSPNLESPVPHRTVVGREWRPETETQGVAKHES
jgi:hypothetical protein